MSMCDSFGAICDDFHVRSQLRLKLELPYDRETLLHFFDRIRRGIPTLNKLRRRDHGALVLEEQGDGELCRRWVRLEEAGLRFGYFAPPDLGEMDRFAKLVLENAPHHLSLSELDFDYQEVRFGFDLEYRGNHDQIVAEALLADHPFASFLFADEARHAIECQPYLGISLTPDCDLLAYVEVKSATGWQEVRTGDYETRPLSVHLTVRKYWGFGEALDLLGGYRLLSGHARDLAAGRVVPLMVKPLAAAIASRS